MVGRRHRATRWGAVFQKSVDYLRYDLCGHCLCHRCHQEYDEHGPMEQRIVDEVIGRIVRVGQCTTRVCLGEKVSACAVNMRCGS